MMWRSRRARVSRRGYSTDRAVVVSPSGPVLRKAIGALMPPRNGRSCPLYVVAVEAAMRTALVLEMRARRRESRNPRSASCRNDGRR